jgi:uncharacterized delta-60 repeat protein
MSHSNTKFLYLFFALFITACSGGGGSDSSGNTGTTSVSGAPLIQFSQAAFNFTANIENTPVAPINSGGAITSCTSSPSLPANLSLDPTTCTISGAPRGASPLANYTITATGPYGSSSATVALNSVLEPESLAGSLNPSFGVNGLSDPTLYGLNIRSMAQEISGAVDVVTDVSTQIYVSRFNSDGSIDATFGNSGLATVACSTVGNPNCEAYNILIESDGKILVSGVTGNATPNDAFFVLRLNTDGSIDTTYGTAGVALVIFTGGIDQNFASAVLDLSTGNLVLAGTSLTGGNWYPAMARLLPTGVLDSSFGTSGQLILSGFASDIVRSFGFDINLNKYYLGTSTGSGGALIRVTSAGVVDSTFGSSGAAAFADSNFMASAKESIAVQFADSGILIGAGSHVLRFNPAGSLDASFGSSGTVTLPSSSSAIQLIVEPSEDILVAAGQVASSIDTVSVTRYSSAGVKDTTFGSSGTYTLSQGNYGNLQFENALVVSTGSLLLLTDSVSNGNQPFLFGLQ